MRIRIRRVLVEGLFGFFRHDIPFNSDQPITIVYGPNGFGKTIILRMLDGLLNDRFEIFLRVPLDAFTVFFEGGSELRVQCFHDNDFMLDPPGSFHDESAYFAPLQVTFSQQPKEPFEPFRMSMAEFRAHLQSENPNDHRFLDSLNRIDAYNLYRMAKFILASNEAMSPFRHYVPLRLREGSRDLPSWMREIFVHVNVKLIETQRLDVIEEEPSHLPSRKMARRPTVVSHSKELVDKIQDILARYASRSQELDRTFPTRLLEQFEPIPETDELQDQLARLEEKRAHLARLGFLDPEESIALPASQAVERKRDVLAVYVADAEKKLAVFDEMAAKIELLTGIINDLFLYKRMHIHREKGYVFTSHIGQEIQPSDLSSGEQHQLVLLYELLFQTRPGSLVLIDEPEISLHVAWQERFLDDLMKVARLSRFDVLVATHSTEIIGGYWDLTVGLRGPDQDRDEPVQENAS